MRWSLLLLLMLAVVSDVLGCGTPSNAPNDDAASADGGADGGGAARPLAPLWGSPTLVDENPDPNIVEVHLRAAHARAVLDDKEIDVIAFNGMIPGPILQARPRQQVIVHFENALDEPTTVHWHGLRIPDTMDGSPRIQAPVPAGGTFTYTFTLPESGSFWYHPHVNTHDQLERGLYGAIVVQDDLDPAYDVERSLVLDDVLLDASGNITPPTLEGFTGLTGRYGNVMLTNGKKAERAIATARKGQVERWRLVNTANARKMLLRLEGARVRLIGTDGGLLTKPIDVTSDVTLPVGGRLDLEISYDAAGPVKLSLTNDQAPITMFAVTVEDSPETPRAIPWPVVLPAVAERPPTASFDMEFDYFPEGWTVNGFRHPVEPILTVNQGATVKIRLSNAKGGVAHPFHMHGQFFRVPNDPNQPGLHDTVMVPGHGIVEIITYFDNPGRWMAHCHILEHAELGMMAEIAVTKTGAPTPPDDAGAPSHPHP